MCSDEWLFLYLMQNTREGERREKIIDKWSRHKLRWSNQHSANLKGCKQCLPSEYILLMRKMNIPSAPPGTLSYHTGLEVIWIYINSNHNAGDKCVGDVFGKSNL